MLICIMDPTFSADRRHQGASGPGAAPDRNGTGLGRQSRQGRDLSQLTPAKNDGSTIYKLNVKNVPVDAFWSVSVYDAAGYFEKNPSNAYTLNYLTAKKTTTARLPSSSAVATARFRIAFRL
jgi:Protein of unknown function (DUF1214)